MTEDIKLICGDCLEKMKEIPDNSIDLILCDLPYGITNCDFDKVIQFAPLWKQYKRIITDIGAIVLFGSEPFSTYLRMSNINMYKYDFIWIKKHPTGFLNCNHRPLKNIEDILVFSRGGASTTSNYNMIYNPQDLVEVNAIHKQNAINNNNHKFSVDNKPRNYIRKYTNYPRQTLYFDRDLPNVHPTQKPVALLEYLIKTYTNEGMTVLDNCMGSGSTGIACINTNRKFIGIEKDEKYFEIAKNRIENHKKEEQPI